MTVEILKAEKGNILSNPNVNNDSIGLVKYNKCSTIARTVDFRCPIAAGVKPLPSLYEMIRCM